MSNTAQNLASTRIASLLDENSFVEIGGYVTARNTDFNMQQTETPGDGVVTWYMFTARLHPFWAVPLEKCMQRRSQVFMTWL